jgi:DNA-binding response OmpR family regulator
VVCAPDGEKDQSQFRGSHYDLVLLDLMIPKISGMAVLKYIRQTSMVPAIIM